MTHETVEADYVIVGAGSAGCALAARIVEDGRYSVLLLEAGPWDRGLFIRMPAGVYRVYKDPKINWNYQTLPQAALSGREIPVSAR